MTRAEAYGFGLAHGRALATDERNDHTKALWVEVYLNLSNLRDGGWRRAMALGSLRGYRETVRHD